MQLASERYAMAVRARDLGVSTVHPHVPNRKMSEKASFSGIPNLIGMTLNEGSSALCHGSNASSGNIAHLIKQPFRTSIELHKVVHLYDASQL